MAELKAHCTSIIGIIILVEYSVVLFPRWLHSKRVKTPGGKMVVHDKALVVESPRWLFKWSTLVPDISSCPPAPLLGFISTPCFCNLCCRICQYTITTKLFASMPVAFCTAEGFNYYGVRDSALEAVWRHWACSASWTPCCSLLKRQLSCVILYDLPWTLPAEDWGPDLLTIMLGSLLNLPSCWL